MSGGPLPIILHGGMQSLPIPAAPGGDPEGLRLAAVRLESVALDLDTTVVNLRNTVLQLTAGGDWTGAAADAFEQRMAEPVWRTLSGTARELERMATSLRRGATAIEEGQAEHRKAEAMAIAAGVLLGVGMLTFAIADVAAADAASAAAAMMARAAASVGAAMRAVAAAMGEVEAAIGTLNARLATGVLSAAASLPKMIESPFGAGLFGALGTAAAGDMAPTDVAMAFGAGYLEGKAGQVGGEAEEPAVPGFTETGVPRRYRYDIRHWEGADRAHVVAVHCAETGPELHDRLQGDPGVDATSTFRDQATAQREIQDAIDARQDEIAAWLAAPNPKTKLVFKVMSKDVVGSVLTREAWEQGRPPVRTDRFIVVLRRSTTSPFGFIVLTAYPV